MVSGEENISMPWQKREERLSFFRFEVVTVILLYTVATISILIGAFFSSEWANQAVSATFLVTIVMVPLASVAIAFGIQIIALMRDSKEREQKYRHEAKFLAGIDRCLGSSA